MRPLLSVIMGSDSDLPIMNDAIQMINSFSVPLEVKIVSAHRTPKFMYDYSLYVKRIGIEVIIAGAGGAAHLPGMMASLCLIPVIGVPIKSKNLSGIDSLLSIAQMPPGIPVATVAINGAKNAAILALQILAVKYKNIKKNLAVFKKEMENEVTQKNKNLDSMGVEDYLNKH